MFNILKLLNFRRNILIYLIAVAHTQHPAPNLIPKISGQPVGLRVPIM